MEQQSVNWHQANNSLLTAIFLVTSICAVHVSIADQRTLVAGQEIPTSAALLVSSILTVLEAVASVPPVDMLGYSKKGQIEKRLNRKEIYFTRISLLALKHLERQGVCVEVAPGFSSRLYWRSNCGGCRFRDWIWWTRGGRRRVESHLRGSRWLYDHHIESREFLLGGWDEDFFQDLRSVDGCKSCRG